MKKRYTCGDLACGGEVCTIRVEEEESSGGEIFSSLIACFRNQAKSKGESRKEKKKEELKGVKLKMQVIPPVP